MCVHVCTTFKCYVFFPVLFSWESFYKLLPRLLSSFYIITSKKSSGLVDQSCHYEGCRLCFLFLYFCCRLSKLWQLLAVHAKYLFCPVSLLHDDPVSFNITGMFRNLRFFELFKIECRLHDARYKEVYVFVACQCVQRHRDDCAYDVHCSKKLGNLRVLLERDSSFLFYFYYVHLQLNFRVSSRRLMLWTAME